MNLFGKKKQAPAPKLSDTIQQLRDAQSMLEKRERHIEKQASNSREEAKLKLKQKNKGGALLLLKRAKMYDKEISQIYGKRANLDVQIMTLEGAASNAEIFKTMLASKNALKVATAQVDVDAVADVMEDITETIQMNDEVNDALSQQLGPALDEDELNAELEEMEQEMVDQQLLQVEHVPTIKQPIVTTTTTTINTNRTEELKMPSVPSRPVPVPPRTATQQQTISVTNSSSSSAPHPPPRKHNIDEEEAKQLKELETMMGM